ncbi:MAG: hypothetical protein QOI41_2616, partial [Myxococcales bacterium]|nr:hypothetical protein [Myxococcales bacterium]
GSAEQHRSGNEDGEGDAEESSHGALGNERGGRSRTRARGRDEPAREDHGRANDAQCDVTTDASSEMHVLGRARGDGYAHLEEDAAPPARASRSLEPA